MNADQFRGLALALPEASELEHLSHPNFRVCGRIFAIFGPDGDWGMEKTPSQQAALVRERAHVPQPVAGGWGLSQA